VRQLQAKPAEARRSRRGSLASPGPSLDFEIIAQGEADKKHEDNRNDVLEDHQKLKAFGRNVRQAINSVVRAK
jgi:hypothetical protein